MVTLYRSASIAPGKTASALAFAREIAGYVSQKTGVEVQGAVPIGGNPNRIGFAARYENLGALETALLKLSADALYMELAKQGRRQLDRRLGARRDLAHDLNEMIRH